MSQQRCHCSESITVGGVKLIADNKRVLCTVCSLVLQCSKVDMPDLSRAQLWFAGEGH